MLIVASQMPPGSPPKAPAAFFKKMEETTHPSKIRPPASAVLGLAVILSILGSGVYILLFGLK